MQRFQRVISQWRRRQVVGGLLLTVVTLVGAVIRLQSLGEPLWVDELHTGWVVSGQASDLGPRAAAGNQAPAYFYVPWLSTKIGEATPFALRFPSLVAGIAVIPLSGWLVWRWTHSSVGGMLAAMLLAIDRDFVFYGVEARVYALLQLVGLVHLAVFVVHQRKATCGTRAVWLGSGVLLFYLHYTTALVMAGEFLVRWCGLLRKRPNWFGLLLEPVLFTLGILPALAHLAEVAERRRNWGELLSADRLATLVPWGPYVAAPLLCVGLVALLWRVRNQRPSWRQRRLLAAWPLVGAFLVPVLAAVIMTESNQAQLLRFRYLILPVTLVPLFAGMVVSLAPSRAWTRVIALIVLLFAFPTSELAIRLVYDPSAVAARRENWPAAIDRLNHDEATRHWPVLLCPTLVEDRQLSEEATLAGWDSRDALVAFCRFPLRSTYVLHRADEDIVPLPTFADRRTNPALRQRITAARGAWLVVRGGERTAHDIARGLLDELNAAGGRWEVQDVEGFGGVTLIKLVWRDG